MRVRLVVGLFALWVAALPALLGACELRCAAVSMPEAASDAGSADPDSQACTEHPSGQDSKSMPASHHCPGGFHGALKTALVESGSQFKPVSTDSVPALPAPASGLSGVAFVGRQPSPPLALPSSWGGGALSVLRL